MINKIKYKIRDLKTNAIVIGSYDVEDAMRMGTHTVTDQYEFDVVDNDFLKFIMHKYMHAFDIKLNDEHNYTIKELYQLSPAMLLDLLTAYGGINYCAELIKGYNQLYIEWIEESKLK